MAENSLPAGVESFLYCSKAPLHEANLTSVRERKEERRRKKCLVTSANLHNEEEGKGATEASLHTRTHLDQEKATLAHDAEC